MGLLQQLRLLLAKPTRQTQDPSFGLLDTLNIGPMLARQQWEQLEATAASLGPEDLTRLLDGLCLTTNYEEALDKYQQTNPSDLARLPAGVHATFVAWQIRGGAYAKYLGDKQIEGFVSYLNKAYEQLNHPFTTAAYQAEAAARTVRVAMGLSEPALAQEAYSYCCDLIPGHLQAHLFYFNALTPKWFGSEEQLEEYVDSAASPLVRPLLQAMYLVELHFAAADSSAIVKQKVRNEHETRTQALLQQSQPLTDGSLYAIYFNNYLACLNNLLGHTAARKAFLQALGSHITPYPWAYFGLEPAAVQKMA